MYETDPFSPLRIQSDQPKLPLENLLRRRRLCLDGQSYHIPQARLM